MNMTHKKISVLSRILLVIGSFALAASLFVPIWRIDLDAPQYPEGLYLLIHADKIAGNVDIINGLNHYIGMKTLHTEDFFEFKILPYLIGFFVLFMLAAAIIGRKKLLYGLLGAFVLFGIVAMADFWRWEYDYGHNLDPNAAIIVPGMAYQPPLIGFKQLLNFGAYSFPDKGGWLMLVSGVLILTASFIEYRRSKTKVKPLDTSIVRPFTAAAIITVFLMGSCKPTPKPIKLNVDNCSHCEMTISDKRFATELVTGKGKVFKFDDLVCLMRHMKENKPQSSGDIYVSDYLTPDSLIHIEQAYIIKGESIGSPMGGNMAAFRKQDSATAYAHKFSASVTTWAAIKQ
jgi:copper chaperone NosL